MKRRFLCLLLTFILVISLSACSNKNDYITVHDGTTSTAKEIYIRIGDIESVCPADTGLYSLIKTTNGNSIITTKNTQYMVTEEVDDIMNMINGNTITTDDTSSKQNNEEERDYRDFRYDADHRLDNLGQGM